MYLILYIKDSVFNLLNSINGSRTPLPIAGLFNAKCENWFGFKCISVPGLS